MSNFCVGPVMSSAEVLEVGGQQIPYFRTPEFSKVMLENEKLVLNFAHAPKDARVVFLTGSGSAAMEAAVMNTLSQEDKAIVVNGGSFGARFEKLLEIHKIPHDTIRLEAGHALRREHLEPYDGKGYTAFLINVDETSTGILYDMDLVAEFAKRNGWFVIADTVSAFLTDPFDMEKWGVGVMLTGSQKALACAPGISLLVLAKSALERIDRIDPACMYLNLKDALVNMERGQTPFTPAVGTLLQIHARLKQIERDGGAEEEVRKAARMAAYFRSKIAGLPFETFAENPANGVTSLRVKEGYDAYKLFEAIKDHYGIWICPNGGALKNTVFRVGHMGDLHEKDYDVLVDALKDALEHGYGKE